MSGSLPPGPVLDCAGRRLDLSRPQVMGILNITPDSFSDGGELRHGGSTRIDRVLRRAAAMVADGAALLDVGGESTRPGAEPVSEQEELDRVLPVVAAISAELDVVISVDTSTPAVMREAAALGAGLLNDVRALRRDGALETAVGTGLPVCLMHMRGEPGQMQTAPEYGDVVAEVGDFLAQRAAACLAAGIPRERILLDPGFGFGKLPAHNLTLLHRLEQLRALDYPLLVGLSRKSLIGAVLRRPLQERLAGSLALAVMALERGAVILRVHDVPETVDAVRLYTAMIMEREA